MDQEPQGLREEQDQQVTQALSVQQAPLGDQARRGRLGPLDPQEHLGRTVRQGRLVLTVIPGSRVLMAHRALLGPQDPVVSRGLRGRSVLMVLQGPQGL